MYRLVINSRATIIIIGLAAGWICRCSSLIFTHRSTNKVDLFFSKRNYNNCCLVANSATCTNTSRRRRSCVSNSYCCSPSVVDRTTNNTSRRRSARTAIKSVTNTITSATIHMDEKVPNMGFLGCGKIASSIITGFLQVPNDQYHDNTVITVTSRSKETSTMLKNTFPGIVRVVETAQEVVQQSDILFLCVLPEQVPTVLNQITLDPQRHTLISLAATCKVDTLVELSKLPTDRVVKMICLPNVCRREGVCLVTPPLDRCCTSSKFWLDRLFTTLGGYLECPNETKMQKFMVITGLMGPMYGLLKTNVDWLVEHGIPPTEAALFVTRTYQSMIQDAAAVAATATAATTSSSSVNPSAVIDHLIQEQTPGGLNEQAYNTFENLGLDSAYIAIMDTLLLRLEKGVPKADG